MSCKHQSVYQDNLWNLRKRLRCLTLKITYNMFDLRLQLHEDERMLARGTDTKTDIQTAGGGAW